MTQEQITDIKIGSNSAIKAMLNNKIVWPYVEKINTEDYMTIEILEDDSYINLGINNDIDDGIFYKAVLDGYSYCINGDGIWISNFYQDYNTPKFKAGDKISFKKMMPSATREIAPKFNVRKIENNEVVKATFNLSGNCMSVIYGDDAKNHYSLLEYPIVFYNMFFSSKVINVSPNFLPATTLAASCYNGMFRSCESLVNAPELPATTLADYCYNHMFDCCFSLTEAPELPATTLVERCYEAMFMHCKSLTTSPELPATTLAERCYYNMFAYCESLTEAPELPATTLTDYCYSHMFDFCFSLTEAPELPATILKPYCYEAMFHCCDHLTKAPDELPATTLADYCYSYMFCGCDLSVAPELPATTLKPYCYSHMFASNFDLSKSPVLPATTLVEGCYQSMFSGCHDLTAITALFDSFGDTSLNATTNWVFDVSIGGVFTMNSNANWKPKEHIGPDGFPEHWTVVYY